MPSKKTEKKTKTKPKFKKLTPTEKLNENIDILKAESEIQNDRYLRLKAEFDNYRRRKEKEFIDLLKYDGESVIKEFLSVVDDLERLSKASGKNDNTNSEKIKEGIDLISNKINKRFTDLEVASFTEPGDQVDPELHDALLMRSEKGKKENEILDVFEKGYRYKDRVIRHAKVVVNQKSS
ncbi:MAG: nucleotide exchange factor GrpE [Candidatus Marinimicrobia bacterium]|mgnify:FL=1|jgi:molecular chaperone GrpE|nr:nucleotide exchange factor GrpE [Candidatus Neomarinimicrobiota bacterium]MBT6782347.1 nucleotide exchange factor GrpE [Candidatus Neomarinimicrobiota bacterium]MBT7084262.1 nucleotide exchange factor GrpE [Candidatus Neomarinimicrobiota bacterium]MBT7972537.1 nucleotide exchange factor GrpE [Candidatus Neomarinimicrobiota bacterium]